MTLATREVVRDAALRALAEARAGGAALWVLDGAAVECCDAAGLGVLLLLEKRARDAGLRFVLARPAPVIVAMLRAAGLIDLLGDVPR